MIPWLSGRRRPAQSCCGGLGEDGVSASSGSHFFPASPLASSATHRCHLLPPRLAVASARRTVSTVAKQIVLLLLSLEAIPPLLLCLSPEAVGAAVRVSGLAALFTGMQKDQQKLVSTTQKDFYYTKFYFNFILAETICESNVALNITEICPYKFGIFLVKNRQKKEFKSV